MYFGLVKNRYVHLKLNKQGFVAVELPYSTRFEIQF